MVRIHLPPAASLQTFGSSRVVARYQHVPRTVPRYAESCLAELPVLNPALGDDQISGRARVQDHRGDRCGADATPSGNELGARSDLGLAESRRHDLLRCGIRIATA